MYDAWLVQEPKVKVDQKDPEGICALMYAAEIGHLHVAQLQGPFVDCGCYSYAARQAAEGFLAVQPCVAAR